MRTVGWLRVAAVGVAALILAPVALVAWSGLAPRGDVWAHLLETRLPTLLWNTARLALGVGVGAGVLGVGLAWLVSVYRFPGRDLMTWMLLLPLAMPAYVTGFVAVATLDASGPVVGWLREIGYQGPVPPIRSWGGVVVAMSLAFYPYVYLLARVAFSERAVALVEAARSLGQGTRTAFFRLSLPLARPAIAAGLALALMETLGDFGTVSVFGYDAITTAIYRVWFGMFDRVAAGQLSLALTVCAIALIWIERRSRASRHYGATAGRPLPLLPLRGGRGLVAIGGCVAVLMAALGLPVAVLVQWSVRAIRTGAVAPDYPALLGNTALVAAVAMLIVVLAGLVLVLARRHDPRRWVRRLGGVAVLGYAMPGSVVAVGVLLLLERADRAIAAVVVAITGNLPPIFAMASLAGLMVAYVVRFSAIARQALQSGLDRIPVALDEAARSLGAGPGRTMLRIQLPLLRRSLVAAALLVGVEVLKEMPMTMLIRPLGFETLAVEVWLRTTEAMWLEAAVPSLAIVATGLVLLGLVHRVGHRGLEGGA